MKHLFPILIRLYSLLICLPIHAFQFSHLNTEFGVQSNHITSIKRDSHGFVWIGTLEGISRFDGQNTVNYPMNNVDGIRLSPRINTIVAIDQWTLRLGTNKGLFSYNYLSNEIIQEIDEEISFYCFAQYNELEIWGTSNGIFLYSPSTKMHKQILEKEHIVGLSISDNTIWVLSNFSLFKLHLQPDLSYSVEEIFRKSDVEFSCLSVFGNSLFFSTRRNGVFFGNTINNTLTHIAEIKARIISNLYLKDDNLYVATDGQGLIVYNIVSKKTSQYRHEKNNPSSLSSNSITCIDIDTYNNLWVGGYSTGVSFTQPPSSISKIPFSSGYSARCILRIDKDKFLVGTRAGLLFYNKGKHSLFSSNLYPEMQSDIILSMHPISPDEYLVGTYGGGVFQINTSTNKLSSISTNNPKLTKLLSGESIYGIHTLQDETYLFTLSGLIVYSQQEIKQFTVHNSALPSSFIYSYFYDKNANLFWIGTLSGLCQFDILQEKITPFIIPNADNKFRTNMILIDNQSNVWIDKNYVEILRINPKNSTVEKIELKNANLGHLSGIIQDNNQKDFWISTTNGIYCYNIDTKQYLRLSKSHGLSSTNFCPNSCFKLDDNTLFWGSEEGIYCFQPTQKNDQLIENSIFVSDIYLNGKEYRKLETTIDNKKSQLQYSISAKWDDLLLIKIVDPSFEQMGEKRYAYKIPNIVNEWEYMDDYSIILNNIPMGNHKLFVKVADEYNKWSSESEVITILIRPNFQSTNFIIIYFVLGVIIVIIMYWKMKKIISSLQIKIRNKDANRKKLPKEVDIEKGKVIISTIRKCLEETNAYKNSQFSLSELAELTQIPLHDISMVINNVLQINFSEFINEYRVDAIKKLLEKDDANFYILHVLAEQCGFNSKTSFYRIFKAKTGYTPIEYRKMVIGKNGFPNSENDQTTK